MKKSKIGQPLILQESLKRTDWYKPGIFYLKKIHPAGTLNKNELVECHNSYGEVLICHESKLIPAPLEELREEKINDIIQYNKY